MKSLADDIRSYLSMHSLPGWVYQYQMANNDRSPIDISTLEADVSIRRAAVTISLIGSGSDTQILMIERPKYDGVHSGQMAFPGGKAEPEDPSLIDTALRETYEEIGLRLEKKSYVCALTPLYIPISRILVYPYVYHIDTLPELKLDDSEVSDMYLFELHSLLSERTDAPHRVSYQGVEIDFPCYREKGCVIWGASAMMLSELLELVKRVL